MPLKRSRAWGRLSHIHLAGMLRKVPLWAHSLVFLDGLQKAETLEMFLICLSTNMPHEQLFNKLNF